MRSKRNHVSQGPWNGFSPQALRVTMTAEAQRRRADPDFFPVGVHAPGEDYGEGFDTRSPFRPEQCP